jgi:DNA-binding CsgD family transcriptional regulator
VLRPSTGEGHASDTGGPAKNSEVTRMEPWGNEDRSGVGKEGPGRRASGSDDPLAMGSDEGTRPGTSQPPAVRPSAPRINWQSALYVFVLAFACVLLVPLTAFWWIVPVLGAAVPISLAFIARPDLGFLPADNQERELVDALVDRGELTPATVAMRTSLTADEASRMLEDLARKGNLRPRAGDGLVSYALRDRDPSETSPIGLSGAPDAVAGGTPRALSEPLSERELEVLALLASGRTNAEIARDLYVAVGTVKSHSGNIYRKLEAANRTEAVSRAREMNLLR